MLRRLINFCIIIIIIIIDYDTTEPLRVYYYVNGPYLLDNLMIKLRLPVVLYVSFAVGSW